MGQLYHAILLQQWPVKVKSFKRKTRQLCLFVSHSWILSYLQKINLEFLYDDVILQASYYSGTFMYTKNKDYYEGTLLHYYILSKFK
jgi:hypothetical protein